MTRSPAYALPTAGLRRSVASYVTERVAASRDPLARLRSDYALELYYEAGDPHSQLAADLARRWLPHLRVPLRILLVPPPAAETYPEEAKQRDFAAQDAARLAPCHGLPAPISLTPGQITALTQALAAAGSDAQAFLAAERTALDLAARGDLGSLSQVDAAAAAVLAANAQRRARLGHYLPGMWQYRGEWFWALDRLDFLQARLQEHRALGDGISLTSRDATALPESAPTAGTPLEFWFSFRSPYSYLAAVELLRRYEAGAIPNLQVRPVLPMVMRGLPVPRVKRLYIVRDVKRCADTLGLAFGRIHDPVGDGVLRLLTVYPYAADVATQLRYCAIAGQTVWAEGLDARRDDVLKSVLDRCGLDADAAFGKLSQGVDTKRAEADREALFAAGLWGVPSFRYGNFTTWGCDRLWMIDRLCAMTAS